uniref:hypothetical protein n=1 Tax=Hydrocytium acuminatum TaxID=1745963 RepID=UPI002A7FFD56|nr:hypothetical protein UYM18_pgp105 [Hydrocytium acuminatum]WOR09515.1 hypothetical protein [Hydrocytium acuminatum]
MTKFVGTPVGTIGGVVITPLKIGITFVLVSVGVGLYGFFKGHNKEKDALAWQLACQSAPIANLAPRPHLPIPLRVVNADNSLTLLDLATEKLQIASTNFENCISNSLARNKADLNLQITYQLKKRLKIFPLIGVERVTSLQKDLKSIESSLLSVFLYPGFVTIIQMHSVNDQYVALFKERMRLITNADELSPEFKKVYLELQIAADELSDAITLVNISVYYVFMGQPLSVLMPHRQLSILIRTIWEQYINAFTDLDKLDSALVHSKRAIKDAIMFHRFF